jgi:hypothetical protein
MRGRLTFLVAGLAVLVVALVPGAVAGAAEGTGSGGKVYVEASINPEPPKVRPHEILLSEDGTFSLYGLKWTSYGGATATATGSGYTRGCTPDCAQGKVYRPRATVRLSQVKTCEGKSLYTRLKYSLVGPIPKGFLRNGTYDLTPLSEQGKPLC